MKKTIAMHEEKEQKHKADDGAPQNAVPAYLLERDQVRFVVGVDGGVDGGGGDVVMVVVSVGCWSCPDRTGQDWSGQGPAAQQLCGNERWARLQMCGWACQGFRAGYAGPCTKECSSDALLLPAVVVLVVHTSVHRAKSRRLRCVALRHALRAALLQAPLSCFKHASNTNTAAPAAACLRGTHCLRMQVDRAKVLSNTIKQKRKEKAGKWEVPLPKVSSWLNPTVQKVKLLRVEGTKKREGGVVDRALQRQLRPACSIHPRQLQAHRLL